MNVDITIYAYITEGDALCPSCATDEVKADDQTSRLYSWQLSEWDDGLWCDECGTAIVEPESGCPSGLCDEPEEDHEDLIGNRQACPDEPRSILRVVESIDGSPFNVAVYEVVVAGLGEVALASGASYFRDKVVTLDIVEEEVQS